MKFASSKLSLVLLTGVAVLLAGCPKKPVRPSPDATAIGQGGGNLNPANSTGSLSPTNIGPDNGGLTQRDPDADANGQIRGKLEPVFFAFDRSSISSAERPKLSAVKDYLDKNTQYRLLVEGHCDWHGTAEYNLALGDRRANEAKKFLVGLGVSADKIDTVSKGSEEAVKNADDAGRKHDRRDEFILLVPGAAPVAPAPGGGAAPAPAAAAPTPATS
ncbi:MAG TPA: OmpA family protein [Opitutaceae bacterium]|jgi:peptidoglycan-associated lipoprotein